MTTVDARASTDTFDMSDGEMVDFVATVPLGMVFYAWTTSGGDAVLGVVNNPGNKLSPLQIDLDYQNDEGADATITPTAPIAASSLTSANGTDPQVAGDKFWTALLSGSDLLLAPDKGRGLLFGDFLSVLSDASTIEDRTGGDDVLRAQATSGGGLQLGIGVGSGRGGSGPWLIGDAYVVAGTDSGGGTPIAYEATLHGGADRISATGIAAYDFAGDAYAVDYLGFVIGGNDILRSSTVVTSLGRSFPRALIGDVVVCDDGTVVGGDDDIRGSDFSFLTEFLSGDLLMLDGGTATGGADSIDGRSGHDFIAGDAVTARDHLTGGDDELAGGDDADIIAGDALQVGGTGPFGEFGTVAVAATVTCGDDDISGEDGADQLAGDIYAVSGLTGGSVLHGGDDRLDGGAGRDRLFGDFGDGGGSVHLGGAVTLTGGDDRLFGGDGDDFLAGQLGRDTLNGGDGNDTADYSEKGGSVRVDLDGATAVTVRVGGVDEDTIRNVENVNGGSGNDVLRGDDGANRLSGGGGEDVLVGRDGADTLSGGKDHDELTGGAGGDRFLFDTPPGDGTFDVITDFSANDRILLDAGAFTALSEGALANGAFVRGNGVTAAQDGNDRIAYDTATGRLYYDADGVGGNAAELIARLTGHPTLAASDFQVV